MPPFDPFAHYLAYGATDQETFRELRELYDGVLVPGTIAAWQRQGTGGFILTLSATPEAPPYMIDPRFPLFQQQLEKPKQSHKALANLVGDAALVQEKRAPTPGDFPDGRLADLARRWVAFNVDYGTTSNEKFDKYAKRLDEELTPEAALAPEAVIAPYFVAYSVDDPWWELSKDMYGHAFAACMGRPCLRVICATVSGALDELLEDVDPSEQLIVWVSGLDEHNATEAELVAYRNALAVARARGQEAFALYGGFFSVLLGLVGLQGAAHGVGFSEHRNWRELPESGAPPARYYLRRAHRYVPQDLAQTLWNVSTDLAACPCPYCDGRPPIALDYHELMKHSVYCRKEEIEHWYQLPAATAARVLSDEHEAMARAIRSGGLTPAIQTRAIKALDHLPVWAAALAP